jgi:hypothetical protein
LAAAASGGGGGCGGAVLLPRSCVARPTGARASALSRSARDIDCRSMARSGGD